VGGSTTRSLGLDVGDKRIGIALSDPGGILASPLTIIERRNEKQDIESIADIISQYQVEKVVVGLPRSLNGSLGEQAEKVRSFIHEFCAQTGATVEFRDERLTTVAAQRLLRAATTKKSKKKVRDDAAAAALILQGYLDEVRM